MEAIDLQEAGTRLSTMLRHRGWSNRELSRQSGVSEQTIRYYIHGERNDGQPWHPTRRSTKKIAAALGLPDGITILRIYGYGDMADQFRAEQERGRNLDGVYDHLERQQAQINRIEEQLRVLVGSGDAKPGYHAPLAPVTDITEWVRRPIPEPAVGF